MKLKLTTFLTAIFVFSATFAQNPKTILDNATSAYNKAGGIALSFTLNTEDSKNKTTYSQDGKASLKGDKFKIEVPDGTTWFDGKTQWVYISDSEEVNVSEPSGEELASISPSFFLSLYKQGFKLNYKGEKKEQGKLSYQIEMIPTKKGEYSKIAVSIDKATNLFNKVSFYGKTGIHTHLLIRKFETNKTYADQIFKFDKKQYPGVEIVDLR